MHRLTPLVVGLLVLTAGGCLEDPVGRDGSLADGDAQNAPTDATTATETAGESVPTQPGGELAVHYLDVGQADATLVAFPNGETMLIDSGDWPQDGQAVLAALDARGVERVDHLVATHPHADHVGGHEAVIDHFEENASGVGAAYDSGVASTSQTFAEYVDAIERHEVPLYTVAEGDELDVGNASVRFLNPPAPRTSEEVHPNSVSLVVEYGDTSFLFTGDLERPGEQRLVSTGAGRLVADVYQAGHHGSQTSSSPAFLDAVDPSIVVISSALDSQYGHPHEETLDAFAERGYETYWTALHGDVTIRTDGAVVSVETERTAPTDAADLAAARETATSNGHLDPTGFERRLPMAGVP